MNKKKIKTKARIVRLMISIILMMFLAIACHVSNKNHSGKEYVNYMETSALEYIVCYVQPNELNQSCLPQTINNYVSKYIDNIKLSFNYKLDLGKEAATDYKYKITGEIIIFDRNNHTLVMERKEYVLLDEKKITAENIEKITVGEVIDLNYNDYNQYVTNYKNNANVSAAAILKVTFHVESSNKYNDISEKIKVNNNITIDIPLGEQTIQLNTNYTPSNLSSNIEVKTNQTFLNNILKVLTIVFGLVGISLIIVIIYMGYKKYKSIPVYTRLIKELKNDFDYEISEISSLIDNETEDTYEYFNVISFKELYDLVKTSTDKKILWNEKKYFDNKGHLKNRISWFFIFITDTKVMRFIVDENILNEEYETNPNVIKKYRG